MSAPRSGPALGLREPKKAKTRAAIQARALRLLRNQGYDATTAQQIIQEAEVSERTFFRYFPTKGDLVLVDDFDPLMLDAFLGQPSATLRSRLYGPPSGALRAAFRAVFDRLSDQQMSHQQRTQLILSVPELRAAMLDQLASAMRLFADVIAERTGGQPGAMAVRTPAKAVVGVVIAVQFAMVDDSGANFAMLLDEAMGRLEAGLERELG